jgi:tetraacyldisaccharide 4'-kinase
LTFLYAHLSRARRRYYTARPERRRWLGRPVISVGNLSVGGSGKTPIVELLARGLQASGRRPSVLSRGYGRADAVAGAVVVNDGTRICADLARAGDEPTMLARNLPGVVVIVCPDRYLAGRLAERRFGCDVHVLDDGFQHVQLGRDVDLLLAGDDDLERPRVLPAGRLREPLDAARHADALLWTGPDGDPASAASRLRLPVCFEVRRAAGRLSTAPFAGKPPAPGARVAGLAAVARPRPFLDGLRASGFDVASEVIRPDHHRYTRRDVEYVRAAVAASGAAGVITTEKDMVRLEPLGPLPFAVAWQRLEVRIEPAAAFEAWLRERLQDADAAAAVRRRGPAA